MGSATVLERRRKAVTAAIPEETIDASTSSPDRVVDAIHQGILNGRYVPGQKLIEADLTESLGISRGPVREALKRLSAEGIVELTRHRGAYIRMMKRRESEDLLAILEVLTMFMTRLAAAAVRKGEGAEHVREAFEWLERFKEGDTQDAAFLDRRRHFYDTLIAIGGNTQLQSVMPMMRIHLLRLQVQPFFSNADRNERLDEYAAITVAVLAGDSTKAEQAMKRHIKNMRERISRLPSAAFARES